MITPDAIPNGCPRTGINKKPHSSEEWGVLFCRASQPIHGFNLSNRYWFNDTSHSTLFTTEPLANA